MSAVYSLVGDQDLSLDQHTSRYCLGGVEDNAIRNAPYTVGIRQIVHVQGGRVSVLQLLQCTLLFHVRAWQSIPQDRTQSGCGQPR